MTPKLLDRSTTGNAQAERERTLRRSFQRTLGHMPTTVQRTLINAAAVIQARFEMASIDPATSHNDFVRLSGEARRAREEMLESFRSTEPEPEPPPSFSEMVANG
jgi:hypothetical protein